MAGAFGYEADKYELSMAVGERVLLPRVRDADDQTLVVADGFSCREQILQATDRTPLHLVEVIQLALHQKEALNTDERPERQAARLQPKSLLAALSAVVVLALLVFGVLR